MISAIILSYWVLDSIFLAFSGEIREVKAHAWVKKCKGSALKLSSEWGSTWFRKRNHEAHNDKLYTKFSAKSLTVGDVNFPVK